MPGLTCTVINAERRGNDRQRGKKGVETKAARGRKHLECEAKGAKVPYTGCESEKWTGAERVNLGFSEAREGIKLKAAIEPRGIYGCKTEQNNQLTCIPINQLFCWHINSQSALLRLQREPSDVSRN